MKRTATIYAQPPGILADFRNDIEARINRHNRRFPIGSDSSEAEELAGMQAGLNRAIDEQRAEVAKLRRIIKEYPTHEQPH